MKRVLLSFAAVFTIVLAMVTGQANASALGSQSGVLTSLKKSSPEQVGTDASPILVKHHKSGKHKRYRKHKYYKKRRYYKGKRRYRHRGKRRHRRYRGHYYPRYGYNRCHRVRRRCARRYGWRTYRWRRCVRWNDCSYRRRGLRIDPFLFPFPY